MGLKLCKNEKINLIAANGVRMPVKGTSIVTVEGNHLRSSAG